MLLHFKSIFLILSIICWSINFSSIPDSRKCIIYDKEGWKCNDSSCIEKEWICDKNNQCENDNSDEEEGCNLYPDTQCKSWNGDKYVKCASSSKCVIFKDQAQVDKECLASMSPIISKPDDTQTEPPNSSQCPDSKWRCTDGLCIDMDTVCDGKKDCDDGSDEEKGCHIYGNECKSWNGQMHVKCRVLEELSFSDSTVCTLPIYNDKKDSSACRKCKNQNNWRCDDGFCIPKDKYRDGIPHCEDGSDEKPVHLRLWKGIIITMTLTAVGISFSFFYRCFVGRKRRCDRCLSCCREGKTGEIKRDTTVVHSKIHTDSSNEQVEDETIPSTSEDTVDCTSLPMHTFAKKDPKGPNPSSKEVKKKCKLLPMELIELLENTNNPDSNVSSEQRKKVAQHLYAKVHQVSSWYRNLYYYFVMRCDSSKCLNKYTSQFHRWEMEFHNNKPIEALKCWRLHLGSCEILKTVLKSLESPSMFNELCILCLPLRNALRSMRFKKIEFSNNSRIDQSEYRFLKALYKVLKCIWYSAKPFLGASFLYFDVLKDIFLCVIMYAALTSIENDELFNNDFIFESWLFAVLVCAIVVVQICWMLISAYYATDIFGICKRWSKARQSGLRILSIFLSPIMPAFVLANYAYYEEEAHSLRRDLQTLGKKRCSLCKMMIRTFSSNSENVNPPENSTCNEQKCNIEAKNIWIKNQKVKLFRDISKVTFKARHFRRIYSFYRVVHAAVEAYCAIAVLVLMLIISNMDGKSKQFLNVFARKISIFMELNSLPHSGNEGQNLLESIDLVHQVTIWGSILYSAMMLLTALARYVYQSKSKNISKCGQLVLGSYFLCHLITRLTNTIAIYTTAEYTEGKNSPIITRLIATIILSVIFIFHFSIIYCYKNSIKEFRERTNIIERLVHVLANTVVVIPFMTWDTKVPSEVDEWKYCSNDDGRRPQRTGSLDKLLQLKELKTIGHRKTFSTGHIPDIESVMKVIENLWWENPTRKLTLRDVRKEFSCNIQNDMTSEIIDKSFEYLDSTGFINKELYNPRRTKKEYLILLTFQVIINFIAICIEIINGGVKTPRGKYIAWDVRILAFCVGIVLLCSYYKKFHILKDLTRVHLCRTDGRNCKFFCCFREGSPMNAKPDYETMQKCLKQPSIEKIVQRTVHTQTSERLLDSMKAFPHELELSTTNESITNKKKSNSVSQLFKKFTSSIKGGVSSAVVNYSDKTSTEKQSATMISQNCNRCNNIEKNYTDEGTI